MVAVGDAIKWDEQDLVPAIAQDAESAEALKDPAEIYQ